MRYGPVIDFLTAHQKYIITAHETPDGDALGAEYAMHGALRRLGKEPLICNADPAPEKFTFVSDGIQPMVLTDPSQLPGDLAERVLLILDVNDINNIGSVQRLVLPRVKEYFIIDHHDSETDILSPNHIEQNASSTCEILYLLFKEMKVRIDLPMAEALYMGIFYDTGSFIYPKTTALTFQIARELVELGVKPNRIYAHVNESNSLSSLVLMSKVLSSLTLHLGGSLAVQTMTAAMIRESQARYEEGDTLINIPLQSKDVRVSVFFKENLEGVRRCSMRSKGLIDVAEIAQSYGGGGHRTAAGFKCSQPFEEILGRILEHLAGKYLGPDKRLQ